MIALLAALLVALSACATPAPPATAADATPASMHARVELEPACMLDPELLEASIRLATVNELFWASQANATLSVPWGELRRVLVARRPRPPAAELPPQPAPPVGDVPQ